jgi:hypothetical protein
MNSDQGKLSVPYTYRVYRLLVFIIFLLIITRLAFNDLTDYDQLKYVLAASVVFMVMERYYPSIVPPS